MSGVPSTSVMSEATESLSEVFRLGGPAARCSSPQLYDGGPEDSSEPGPLPPPATPPAADVAAEAADEGGCRVAPRRRVPGEGGKYRHT